MNIEPKLPTWKGPQEWFTGDVYVDPIAVRKPEPSRMAAGCVHFTPGARTAWHSHAAGPDPVRGGGRRAAGHPRRAGDRGPRRSGRVHPAGEEHWHGATPDGFMAHIALYEGTEDGDGATWLEHVTDEQYHAG